MVWWCLKISICYLNVKSNSAYLKKFELELALPKNPAQQRLHVILYFICNWERTVFHVNFSWKGGAIGIKGAKTLCGGVPGSCPGKIVWVISRNKRQWFVKNYFQRIKIGMFFLDKNKSWKWMNISKSKCRVRESWKAAMKSVIVF